LAEALDDDMGDIAGALAGAVRAQDLEPFSYALGSDRAIKLSRLGRYDEARKVLDETASMCGERDRAAMAPAYADLFMRTRNFPEGIRYIGDEIRRMPNDADLRILRARLYLLSGDTGSAERDYEGILKEDPASQPALEGLLGLMAGSGRSQAAEVASIAAVDRQPSNLANDLRAAVVYGSRHDDANEVKCLLAAEKCGPVTSAVEFRLAQGLFKLGDFDGTLTHLALARRISLCEGNPEATESIEKAIDGLWQRLK
jgi:Flp pilus assembly protein TadD